MDNAPEEIVLHLSRIQLVRWMREHPIDFKRFQEALAHDTTYGTSEVERLKEEHLASLADWITKEDREVRRFVRALFVGVIRDALREGVQNHPIPMDGAWVDSMIINNIHESARVVGRVETGVESG